MITRIALALLLAWTVAGCGGEEQAEEAAGAAGRHEPPGPTESAKSSGPALQLPLEIALDDTTLGALLEHHQKVVAAGADVAGAMAIGAGSDHDYRWYAQALETWRALEEATSPGTDGARQELERLDERIAELQAALASASEETKADAQRTLELTRKMRPALAKHVASLKGLDSPGNRKLVERWKPRFDAVTAKPAK